MDPNKLNHKGRCEVLFVRHGERADLAPEKGVQYDIECDPPLTPLGVTQVEETAEYLARYVKERGFDEVVIEASGFIRTIQTACAFSKAIGVKVHVNYQYTEWLHPNFYEENPMPLLYVRNRDKNHLREVFTKGEDFHHDPDNGFAEANKIYPEETIGDVMDRVTIVRDQLIKKYQNSDKKVLHIVSTHAAIVKALSMIYGMKFQGDWCYFCAFTGFEVIGEEHRIIYDEDSTHVKARL